VLVLAGLLPWQFVSNALGESGNSLLNNSNLISKVYFPRMLIPASAVLTSFVDLCISGLLLAGAMILYGCHPDWRLVFAPLVILLVLAGTAGAGLWLSALTVRYRDLRMVIPFALQAGYFLSPIGYRTALVPEKWRLLYSLNPLAGIIDGFRWSVLGTREPLYWPGVCLSVAMVILLLASGAMYFRRTEESFADII
jgi:lipopolysaccharide transport system permease protein